MLKDKGEGHPPAPESTNFFGVIFGSRRRGERKSCFKLRPSASYAVGRLPVAEEETPW